MMPPIQVIKRCHPPICLVSTHTTPTDLAFHQEMAKLMIQMIPIIIQGTFCISGLLKCDEFQIDGQGVSQNSSPQLTSFHYNTTILILSSTCPSRWMCLELWTGQRLVGE